MIITMIASGIATNLTLFFYSYFWEFTPLNILTIGLTLFLTPLIGLKVSPFLAATLGKRKTIIYLFAIAFIAENIIILMRILNKDLLNLKFNKSKSYWIEKNEQKSKMKNQF